MGLSADAVRLLETAMSLVLKENEALAKQCESLSNSLDEQREYAEYSRKIERENRMEEDRLWKVIEDLKQENEDLKKEYNLESCLQLRHKIWDLEKKAKVHEDNYALRVQQVIDLKQENAKLTSENYCVDFSQEE